MCIDLENTLVVLDEYADQVHLEAISRDKEFFYKNYVVIVDHNAENKPCRHKLLKQKCLCNKKLYRIKPYALDFLRNISTFYEIIAFSKLSQDESNQIVFQLEALITQ